MRMMVLGYRNLAGMMVIGRIRRTCSLRMVLGRRLRKLAGVMATRRIRQTYSLHMVLVRRLEELAGMMAIRHIRRTCHLQKLAVHVPSSNATHNTLKESIDVISMLSRKFYGSVSPTKLPLWRLGCIKTNQTELSTSLQRTPRQQKDTLFTSITSITKLQGL